MGELVVGLLVNFVLEALFEVVLAYGFRGLTWLVTRRWRRLLLGATLALGGGLLWPVILNQDAQPLVVTAFVALQALAALVLHIRQIPRWQAHMPTIFEVVVIGAAIVAGRWIAWLW